MTKNTSMLTDDELQPTVPLPLFLLILAASAGGALAAVLVIPSWIPMMGASLLGSAPQAFWFLSRSSALVSYLLLWLSMCLGLMITNKLARLWPGGPAAFEIHQHTSLLGVAFALFHGLILLGDRYLDARFWQVLLPFGLSGYHPWLVGLGQMGFYLMVLVTISFYLRKKLTARSWRSLHYLSFASFFLALLHGITAGSDGTAAWAQILYWSTGGVFLLLLVYRILSAVFRASPARQPQLGK
jgi:predicted ferric reductase